MVDPEESIDARLASVIEELAVSRQETVVSRGETAVSQQETAVSQQETALSQQETALSQQETAVSQEQTRLSHMETAAALVRVENLEVALKTARVIGMAMGILMSGHGLSEGAAFEALSDASQQQNRKVREIADEVVRTGVLPT